MLFWTMEKLLLLFWVLLLMLAQFPGEFKLDFTDISVSKCL